MNLKDIKSSVCGECHKRAIPGQPLVRCRECKKKFCLDHIWVGYCNPKSIRENEELGYVCEVCKEKFGYIDLDEYLRIKNTL